MKKIITVLCFVGMGLIFSAGCKAEGTNSAGVNAAKKNEEMKFNAESAGAAGGEDMKMTKKHYTKDTKVADVINDPVFGNFARLLFPLNANYWSGERLKDIRLLWYSHINADNTAEILNALKEQALLGRKVFYDIYPQEEKNADPEKKDTGLFFFRGRPGEKFAVVCAGGGFSYVGAIHDSFPHALELSRKGYNAFALIYRADARFAFEDLARAIAFIFDNARELEVDTKSYSLWGGSVGAKMAARLGSYGTAAFGEKPYPKPGSVIIQYTELSGYSPDDPPTFVCVGDSDYIANWKTMKARTDSMSEAGIPTEFHVYGGLGHGFGLGLGTEAEGWIDKAVEFWQKHMRRDSENSVS